MSNNEEYTLGYSWTNKSEYAGGLDYIAKRYDIYSSETLHHYQDVSVYGAAWAYTNSIDVYRRSAIQRGGYSSTYWSMYQLALGSCF